MKKTGNSTQRGVFAVDKAGKVLLAEAGGPAATVEAVKRIVTEGGTAPPPMEAGTAADESAPTANGAKGATEPAEVAAEVADSAAKVDSKEAATAVA